MRQTFHDELDQIGRSLVEMNALVSVAMQRATAALLNADLNLAERVISDDGKIDAVRDELEGKAFDLLARQQPVAGDLRIIVTSLRMVADLERMGDLALHIAKVARMRYPSSAVPTELRETILEMGRVAERIAGKAGDAIAGKDTALAEELERDDDAMDTLHRRLFAILLSDDWAHGVEAAVDIALLGRYYERIADHAVSVGNRVVFVVTGQFPVSIDT
jgi:phosphate transport system protein